MSLEEYLQETVIGSRREFDGTLLKLDAKSVFAWHLFCRLSGRMHP
jgi:hypothetical protein